VTPTENKRRTWERRTVCKSGRHPRTPNSRYETGTNAGRCKECVCEASRNYSERKRKEVAA
jgi:hypothetical protein